MFDNLKRKDNKYFPSETIICWVDYVECMVNFSISAEPNTKEIS